MLIRMFLSSIALSAGLAPMGSLAAPEPQEIPPRWWKGNTHTHTLWSDGNAAPELVAKWYVDHAYDFLVLSDHNILSEGEKWFPVIEDARSRLTSARVDELKSAFGDDWVELREQDARTEMRLKTLDELRQQFEMPGEFLFIQGEEITDSFNRINIHINGVNLDELVPPQHGESVQDTIQRNIDAVIEQGKRLGKPMLAHVNHPNFTWALTPEDIAAVRGERFFEVYNGHSGVRNRGDKTHPSTEAMWDIALTLRLTELNLGLMYGLATDDSHDYFGWGVGRTNPGRGWLMVQAAELTPEAIVNALHAGNFYASTGVTLAGFSHDDTSFTVSIEAEEGLTYTTEFIGTRRANAMEGEAAHGPIGEVLFSTTSNPAVYTFVGDELYVRAKVTSSRLHPNPFAEGDHETAWVQPVIP